MGLFSLFSQAKGGHMNYKEIATTIQELQTQVKEHSREFFWFLSQDVNRDSVGWPLLIISKFDEILETLGFILEQLGEVHERLDTLSNISNPGASPLQIEVEDRFGKPVQELLKERKGQSLREIAKELGVSRGTVSNWRTHNAILSVKVSD